MNALAEAINDWAHDKGFWYGKGYPTHEEKGLKIALIHSELGELTEAMRHPGKQDQHCPGFSNEEIEAADAIIRILDLARQCGWKIGQAVVEKMLYNETRAYKHGKAF